MRLHIVLRLKQRECGDIAAEENLYATTAAEAVYYIMYSCGNGEPFDTQITTIQTWSYSVRPPPATRPTPTEMNYIVELQQLGQKCNHDKVDVCQGAGFTTDGCLTDIYLV